jgi:hypothetical protein
MIRAPKDTPGVTKRPLTVGCASVLLHEQNAGGFENYRSHNRCTIS